MKIKINYLFKIFTIAAVLVLFTNSLSAQKTLNKARDLKMKYEYVAAIEMYKEYLKTAQAGIEEKRDLATCYMMTGDTRSAEEWLFQVVSSPDYTAEDVLHYAEVLKTNGKYPEAIVQYKNYGKLVPSASEKSAIMVQACETAMDWMKDPVYFDIVNADGFNTENSEFGLTAYDNGYILTSNRKLKGELYSSEEISGWTGKPFLKLLLIKDKNNLNAAPSEIKAVNNSFHNGPGIYDKNTGTLYFTQTKMVKLTKKPLNCDPTSWYDNSTTKNYMNRLEIFSVQLINGKWQDPVAFKYNNPNSHSVGHPAISPDGKVMYFISDMPGGFGQSDIYYCEKLSDGTWSEPKNAGNSINSDGKEMFPYIASDGTLYFSSMGLSGMGGLDLYYAKGSKDTWTTPENMKYPFNSPKDDFSIYFSEEGTGYFASNRDGGKGDDDIYSFVPAPPKNLILSVIAKEKLENSSTAVLQGVTIRLNNDYNTLTPAGNGAFNTQVDCNSDYVIKGVKEGYFSSEKKVTTQCQTRHDTLVVEMVFEKIIIDKVIVIKDIYYDYDKWDIRPDAALELDKLVELLNENPDIIIELGSHTDCRATKSYNDKLSSQRAKSCVDYLISKGIDPKRLSSKGYGETQLLTDCKCDEGTQKSDCTEEQHQLNRRTEFKVKGFIKGKGVDIKSNQ